MSENEFDEAKPVNPPAEELPQDVEPRYVVLAGYQAVVEGEYTNEEDALGVAKSKSKINPGFPYAVRGPGGDLIASYLASTPPIVERPGFVQRLFGGGK